MPRPIHIIITYFMKKMIWMEHPRSVYNERKSILYIYDYKSYK